MNTLPVDVLLLIFRLLSPPELLVLAQVDKALKRVASDDRLWVSVEKHLERHYPSFVWVRGDDQEEKGLSCKARVYRRVARSLSTRTGEPSETHMDVKVVVVGDGAAGKTTTSTTLFPRLHICTSPLC